MVFKISLGPVALDESTFNIRRVEHRTICDERQRAVGRKTFDYSAMGAAPEMYGLGVSRKSSHLSSFYVKVHFRKPGYSQNHKEHVLMVQPF